MHSRKTFHEQRYMNLFLFHRSLRLEDNLGLIQCCKESKKVIPLFILDPRQLKGSKFALGFMKQSLQDLKKQTKNKLAIAYGLPHKVIQKLMNKYEIQTVYMNEDYTPFARKRAEDIQKVCPIIECKDYLLHEPIREDAYKVYTPFWKKIKNKKVQKPKSFRMHRKFHNIHVNKLHKIKGKFSEMFPGGRKEGLKRMKHIKKKKDYHKMRNYLWYDTTLMSPYIKFGCVSIREVWKEVQKLPRKSRIALQKQLIWREFYYHYFISYPEELEWKTHKLPSIRKNIHPLVQATLNQLKKVGFIHNRGRMLLATHIIHKDKNYWKAGDIFFMKNLVDYDPFVNIGNWLWINKQPSFKHMKPESTSKKWDKEKLYENKWNNI